MPRWIRAPFAALVVAALLAVLNCSGDQAPTAPLSQPSRSLVSTTTNLVSSTLDLLACSEQPYAVATAVIGPAGGTISVGTHRLVVPPGALRRFVSITAEQVSGSTNSVRLSPAGLRFAKPAALTLSYANCSLVLLPKRVAFTDELLRILEIEPSLDRRDQQEVTGSIDHFSRYVVAY